MKAIFFFSIIYIKKYKYIYEGRYGGVEESACH